jgi:hypothetical protein
MWQLPSLPTHIWWHTAMGIHYLYTHYKELVHLACRHPLIASGGVPAGGRGCTVRCKQHGQHETLLPERATEATETDTALARCKRFGASNSHAPFARRACSKSQA